MKEHSAKYPVPRQFISWLFLLVLPAVGACTQPDLICCGNPDDGGAAGTRLAGTWQVVAYEDLASNARTVKNEANSPGGLDVVLTFEGNRITGRSTTNQVNGKFAYTGTRQVRIEEYGGTEIAEPQWGRMFGEAVFKFKEFTINDNTLTFFYNNGQNAVTLEKQ